ncbi:MAG: efflux RND transporter permease subunit [Bacteroidales bacterium]|nr:efflux RND transporter permease subunit [Bacteroidales bacterium]
MKITEISVKRTTIPVVLFTILILGGIYSFFSLSEELTPNMDFPVNTITTVYPGASPSEVENSVTKKIEDAVSTISGIKKINSYSYEGFSMVVIQYVDGSNSDQKLEECQRKVNIIRNQLPANAKDPQFVKFDINNYPIMNIAANSNLPASEFYDLIDRQVKPVLAQIKGVAKVDIIGGHEREIQIKADAEKLDHYGISILQLKQILEASNLDFPTGEVTNGKTRMLIRLSGKYTKLQTISDQVIGYAHDGAPIRVKDVAYVVDGVRKPTSLARINGNPAIGISIQKQTGANAVDISAQVKKTMASFEKEYAANNLKFTIASDTSDFTKDAVNSVMIDLLLAIVLVSITMLLFLHSFRNLLFVFISIPTSLISTFLIFKIFGFSLNLLTLLALSIVVGAIVDDAIVVLENIYRHMEMGKTRLKATLEATQELGMTVTSITVVLIVVFLPIGLTVGITGQILRAFSFVVVFALLLSLLVSFTLVPLLTSQFAKIKEFNIKNPFDRFLMSFEKFVVQSRERMLDFLRWALKHKATVIGVALALFFSSFLLVTKGYIQAEFMDQGDRGEFNLTMELNHSATLEYTNSLCSKIENILLSYPQVKMVYTKVGLTSGKTGVLATPYEAEFSVTLVPKDKRKESTQIFAKKLQYMLSSTFPGPEFNTHELNILGNSQDPIEIYVRGSNYSKVVDYSKVLLSTLKTIKGTSKIESSISKGNKEYVIKVNRDKMARLGLTLGQVGATMYMAFEGNTDLKYSQGDKEYDMKISLDNFDRRNKSDLDNMSFINHSGKVIRLDQFADISEGVSPSRLDRFNKLPAVEISGQTVGKTVGTIKDELVAELQKTPPPAGVYIFYGGDMEQQSDSFSSLLMALITSIVLMYLIMVALYDSYIHPLVVMLSLPLAIIGALWALALADKTLSIFSIMGIIMLMGLVAKNAILVVDFANELRNKGVKAVEAAIEATRLRFRPILMTNLALIVGMLPIALANGAGSEWKSSLGWVLIGGLISSLFLSLIIVPVLFVIFDRFVKRNHIKE